MLARWLALGTVLVAGVTLGTVLAVLPAPTRQRAVRGWSAAVLAALGVRLVRRGPAQFGRGVLVVANHVSWLDVVALWAVQPVRLVAKREVRGWPLLGTLAAAAGTVFLERERLRALPGTVAEVAGVLRAGTTVGVFPEGTTWCGVPGGGGDFRPALFEAAVRAGAPVQPVALHYRLADGRVSTAAAFVAADTLWHSLRRVVRLRGLTVEVEVLPRLHPPGGGRRMLARAAGDAVQGVRADQPRSVSRVISQMVT